MNYNYLNYNYIIIYYTVNRVCVKKNIFEGIYYKNIKGEI